MDSARIEELKRRIQRDPASIAFAQLGEEYRRAGRSREAIEVCRAGLTHHPGYLSARVTLGRALLETGDLEQAEHELKEVLRLAPENLAALRGVADARTRRGDPAGALSYCEIALALAPRDVDLLQTVAKLREQTRPQPAAPAISEMPPAPPVAAPASAPPAPAFATAAPLAVQASATPVAAQASVVPAAAEASAAPAPVRAVPAALQVLERWLELIVADRQRRLSAAGGA